MAVTRPDIAAMEATLGRAVVKLDANENPYGPSPLVAEAIERARVERYPDPACTILRRRLAEYLNVAPECIACGAGADELIDLLFRLLVKPGDEVLDSTPSFPTFQVAAGRQGISFLKAPRGDGFAIDFDAVEAALTPRTKVIIVCSPNNPTGNSSPVEDIERLLSLERIVILDEAYAEFAGRSLVEWGNHHPNLIVLRTFSKWAALAGLRLGYVVARESIVRGLAGTVSPYQVSVVAQAAGIASLDDSAYLMRNVERINENRRHLHDRLATLPLGTVYPSETSFLYWECGHLSADDLRDAMGAAGVLVRSFHDPREAIRISVGLPEECDAAFTALSDCLDTLLEARTS
ncbi:MAG: histidinol-phosphate transaminase [Chloroflexota bacterium]